MQERCARKTAPDGLAGMVNHYLSTRHRDSFDKACPLAALGSDLRRGDERTREIASDGLARMVSIVAGQMAALPSRERKARATALVSTLVGSMVLSRIATDPVVSGEILKAGREFILQCTQTT